MTSRDSSPHGLATLWRVQTTVNSTITLLSCCWLTTVSVCVSELDLYVINSNFNRVASFACNKSRASRNVTTLHIADMDASLSIGERDPLMV